MSSPRCPALLSFLDARRDVTRQRWQVDQLIDAPCKGDVAQVSEDWHLEDMEEIQVWKVVDPLRVRPEVPKFPQRAAEQARQPDRECNPPVSRYQGCENTPAALNQNDTVKYEKWATQTSGKNRYGATKVMDTATTPAGISVVVSPRKW